MYSSGACTATRPTNTARALAVSTTGDGLCPTVWARQYVKVKSFLGRSEKAVRIHTALITYLLLPLYRKAQDFAGSL